MKPWTPIVSWFSWVTPGTKRQNIWSSFIHSSFFARSFDQELLSSLIYFFYLYTTIRPTYMVLFHLFFFCVQPFDQNIWSPFVYSLLQTTIRPKYMVLFHLFFLLCTTIRAKIRVLFNLFLLFTHDNSTMVLFHLFFLYCTTIRPRIMALIDLFLLFANDHSTKIYALHSFIFFIYTWPFDQYVWFPFIYSFFCKRPFD